MTLIERWFHEVWNEGNEASIDTLLAPHGIAYGLNDAHGNPVSDRESFKAYYRTLRSSLTKLHVTVQDVLTVGDQSVARCHVAARHTGDGLGIAPTNKPVSFTGMSWARFEDGQIVEGWNNFDFMTMFQQLQ